MAFPDILFRFRDFRDICGKNHWRKFHAVDKEWFTFWFN